jgi:hypothetical protein
MLSDAVHWRTTVSAAGWIVDVARVLLGTLNVLMVPFATGDTGLTCENNVARVPYETLNVLWGALETSPAARINQQHR